MGCGARGGFLPRHDEDLREPLLWRQGSQVSMRVARRSAATERFHFHFPLSTFTFHFHGLEKEMETHSSVLAWRIPGMGDPGGPLSMGSHRVGHD